MALVATAVVYAFSTTVAAWAVRVREEQVIDALDARGLSAPDGVRAIWADSFVEARFAGVAAALFLLVVVATGALERRRWLPAVVATVLLAAWTQATWGGSGCALPWPGPVDPARSSGLVLTGIDPAGLGPAVLLVTAWAGYAMARTAWGREQVQPVQRGLGTAVAVPVCGMWVLTTTGAAVVVGSTQVECWYSLPAWWMVLTIVPVAALVSGRGTPTAVVLLVPLALLSAESLRHAAFTLEAATLVPPACAVAAAIGALAWRPMARALTEAQT